jgi:hypothetical protein
VPLAPARPRAWRRQVSVSGPVRAENRIHGSDQQSCSPGGRPVMITDHVPAVLLPSDHAGRRVAAAVPAGGCVEDRRDPDPAPPARGPAAPAGGPPEAGVGGPRAARGPGGRDTEGTPPGAAAAGHAGHDPALAPRHRPPPLGHQLHSRQDRPAGDTAEHQGPGPPARTREPRMGVPQDPRRAGRAGSQGRRAGRRGDPQGQRHRPRPATTDRSGPGSSSWAPRPGRSWHAASSRPACPAAPRPTSWP